MLLGQVQWLVQLCHTLCQWIPTSKYCRVLALRIKSWQLFILLHLNLVQTFEMRLHLSTSFLKRRKWISLGKRQLLKTWPHSHSIDVGLQFSWCIWNSSSKWWFALMTFTSELNTLQTQIFISFQIWINIFAIGKVPKAFECKMAFAKFSCVVIVLNIYIEHTSCYAMLFTIRPMKSSSQIFFMQLKLLIIILLCIFDCLDAFISMIIRYILHERVKFTIIRLCII